MLHAGGTAAHGDCCVMPAGGRPPPPRTDPAAIREAMEALDNYLTLEARLVPLLVTMQHCCPRTFGRQATAAGVAEQLSSKGTRGW